MFAQLLLILINNYNYTMKKVEALMISVSVLSHRLVFPKKKKDGFNNTNTIFTQNCIVNSSALCHLTLS